MRMSHVQRMYVFIVEEWHTCAIAFDFNNVEAWNTCKFLCDAPTQTVAYCCAGLLWRACWKITGGSCPSTRTLSWTIYNHSGSSSDSFQPTGR